MQRAWFGLAVVALAVAAWMGRVTWIEWIVAALGFGVIVYVLGTVLERLDFIVDRLARFESEIEDMRRSSGK